MVAKSKLAISKLRFCLLTWIAKCGQNAYFLGTQPRTDHWQARRSTSKTLAQRCAWYSARQPIVSRDLHQSLGNPGLVPSVADKCLLLNPSLDEHAAVIIWVSLHARA